MPDTIADAVIPEGVLHASRTGDVDELVRQSNRQFSGDASLIRLPEFVYAVTYLPENQQTSSMWVRVAVVLGLEHQNKLVCYV